MAKLIVLLLEIALALTQWAKAKALFSEGEDAALGKLAHEILRLTDEYASLKKRIDDLGDDAVNELFDKLGKRD